MTKMILNHLWEVRATITNTDVRIIAVKASQDGSHNTDIKKLSQGQKHVKSAAINTIIQNRANMIWSIMYQHQLFDFIPKTVATTPHTSIAWDRSVGMVCKNSTIVNCVGASKQMVYYVDSNLRKATAYLMPQNDAIPSLPFKKHVAVYPTGKLLHPKIFFQTTLIAFYIVHYDRHHHKILNYAHLADQKIAAS